MAHIIIDRRKNTRGKSTVNRQRYLRRVHAHVKEAVKRVIQDGKIGDMTDGKGKRVRIPKGLKKPEIHHDPHGGTTERVYPGNKEFNQGDHIPRPPSGKGSGGKQGTPDGEGEDSFEFTISQKEFLDYFFQDLELPDLVKKQMLKLDEWVYRRAGFAVDGNPARLDIVRSMRQSVGRRTALTTPKRKELKKLEKELELLEANPPHSDEQAKRITEIIERIAVLKRKIKAIPFIDDIDLRYRRWERVPIPSTQAVMFCIMDVSASMGEWEKEMSKRFFMLLYLFLMRNYERVDIVFIRHHTSAKEVDEEEFFHSRETGGTIVSSSLRLMRQIIDERYSPEHWNIFGCQASDGDNWGEDTHETVDILTKSVLSVCQYYAYVEIDRSGGKDSDLWPHYERVQNSHNNFQMAVISDVTEIYPVFRGLFEKKEAS